MYKVPAPGTCTANWSDDDWIAYIDNHKGWLFPLKPHPQECLVSVSKEKFYATVGKMNVHPSPQKYHTAWKTPSGTIVGWTTPGYLLIPYGEDEKQWFVRETLL
jgi:hypothetical protein